jgi:hypothetical protein
MNPISDLSQREPSVCKGCDTSLRTNAIEHRSAIVSSRRHCVPLSPFVTGIRLFGYCSAVYRDRDELHTRFKLRTDIKLSPYSRLCHSPGGLVLSPRPGTVRQLVADVTCGLSLTRSKGIKQSEFPLLMTTKGIITVDP